MIRIGQGFDVHQVQPNRRLVIGGVEIPYNKGLLGHSDADVLVHAMIDAVLGAAGYGDIGQVYPDTDIRFKDADSIMLLVDVMQKILADGFTISNIDCTILAEQPKMAPYLEQMKNILARACKIEHNQLNLKATTMEKMGFIGREEGIGAIAVALLEKKKED